MSQVHRDRQLCVCACGCRGVVVLTQAFKNRLYKTVQSLRTYHNGHKHSLCCCCCRCLQVHGHDFSCLASIPAPDSSSSSNGTSSTDTQQMPLPPSCLMYVSGSEEKVLRVFEAPQTFTESLTAVRALQSPAAAAATAAAFAAAASSNSSSDAAAGSVVRRGRALGASVSALGLSNKAVYVDEESESAGFSNHDDESSAAGGRAAVGAEAYMEGPDFVPTAVPAVVSGPPLEEHLAQNTLWPEVRKLYGHGNDVYCACASPSGRVIASACKAQSMGAAAVWVWEVSSWKALAQLPGHTLTVTQLEFSPDGTYLLSGSRDRSFSVWKVPLQYRRAAAAAAATGSTTDGSAGTAAGWDLVGRLKAAHSRIIWSVSWSHDGRWVCGTGHGCKCVGGLGSARSVSGVCLLTLLSQRGSTAAAL